MAYGVSASHWATGARGSDRSVIRLLTNNTIAYKLGWGAVHQLFFQFSPRLDEQAAVTGFVGHDVARFFSLSRRGSRKCLDKGADITFVVVRGERDPNRPPCIPHTIL